MKYDYLDASKCYKYLQMNQLTDSCSLLLQMHIFLSKGQNKDMSNLSFSSVTWIPKCYQIKESIKIPLNIVNQPNIIVQWNFSKQDPQKTGSPWISADFVSPYRTIFWKRSLTKPANHWNQPYFLVWMLAGFEKFHCIWYVLTSLVPYGKLEMKRWGFMSIRCWCGGPDHSRGGGPHRSKSGGPDRSRGGGPEGSSGGMSS
jgi:hypothetical protein